MTHDYYCILCGFIASFIKPMPHPHFKCPWCEIVVETRSLSEEMKSELKGKAEVH